MAIKRFYLYLYLNVNYEKSLIPFFFDNFFDNCVMFDISKSFNSQFNSTCIHNTIL